MTISSAAVIARVGGAILSPTGAASARNICRNSMSSKTPARQCFDGTCTWPRAGPDESMRLCGDWKMWSQMLLRSDLAHVSEPLNYFRTHAQNVRSNTRQWQIILESIAVYETIAREVTIPPERLEFIRNGLADAAINAWLHRHAIDPQLRTQTLATLAGFDPGYRRRISRRIFSRALSLARRGRLRQWSAHVARRMFGLPKKPVS